MNGGFGPGLGISSSPLMGGNNSGSSRRFASLGAGPGYHRSHTSSYGSSYSERIQPHPSHYVQARPNSRPGPVGTIAPGKGKWMVPLCHEPENDLNTCCLGCWCPQILYGRTQFRLMQMAQDKDPLDLTEYKKFNGPCGTFMLLNYVTNFSWVFVMLQHSRIRAMYDIDGTIADDCCSACACPNCTLMQDDREIRAREYKDGKNEKRSGAINHQPSIQPDMQYASPHLFGDDPYLYRGSLVRTKPTTVVTGQNQRALDHSQHHNDHKGLHKTSKIDLNKHITREKSKTIHDNHRRSSANRSSSTNLSTFPNQEDRDAILPPGQKWGKRNFSGKQEEHSEHATAARRGDDTRGSENQNLATNRSKLLHYSNNASISRVRGKRVLEKISRTKEYTAQSKALSICENPTDESVLVFYEDGEQPQQHRLADCARIRASTLARTDTSRHSDLPMGWREERAVLIRGQPKESGLQELAACPEVVVTEDLKPLDPNEMLHDYAVENTSETKGDKQRHYELQSSENCTGDAETTGSKAIDLNITNPDSVEHRLQGERVFDTSTNMNRNPTVGISQHSIAECVENGTEIMPERSAAPDGHQTADYSVAGDAQAPELLDPNQHAPADCTIVVNDIQSETSKDISSAHDHPGLKQATEQNESHPTTLAVPRPPLLVVTTSSVSKDAREKHHDQSRSKSSSAVATSYDSTMPAEHFAASPKLTKPLDEPKDIQDGQQPPSEAAAALHKVLQAANDVRHVETATEFKADDPIEVNAAGTAKGTSQAPCSKAFGERARKSKGYFENEV